MTPIFLFALILGGGLLGLSLLGDLFGGVDADLDADFEADVDPVVAADPHLPIDQVGAAAGAAVDASGDLSGAIRIFTIRTLTYFLFGFGAVGWLLVTLAPELPIAVVTAAAAVSGGLAGALAGVVFGWLRATDSGWQSEEASFVGCEARVLLPVAHGRPGQIMVLRGDREHELRALPFDQRASEPEAWRNVVVIDMDGGTARVSPLEALAPADPGPAFP